MSSNASSKNPVRVPTEKKAELYLLTNPPKVAWPTVMVLAYIVVGVISVDVAAVRGLIPLWAGMLLNVVTMFPMFHVMHDAMHRAASSNVKLNDWIGRIDLLVVGPHTTLELCRYSHMMHHRFTNDAKDPDNYIHGSWWTLPLRWMTFDFSYAWYNLTNDDPRSRKVMLRALPNMIATALVAGWLIDHGYGWYVLLLWFIPTRIVCGLIAFVFLWLPHLDGDENGKVGHITSAGSTTDNLTAGTTIRLGSEGILNFLMQWHNYHLIHHLWPTTPSYNHAKVWKLMEPELRERDLRIQYNFDLIPTLHRGGTTAAGAR
ncbi:fatty acid desaturase [Rugamonas apoptosis]|uniref:Fatty acid desaturase n=1 Tax=Rugamonas apoptosis TaxID=2758570 RepID=A0A7W2FC94_9BURK|nr:fatty acid desaturase [Rugamonas apoptosis]MBA5688929.1 fatty acid desaturase [Rugamonas apoptosis]